MSPLVFVLRSRRQVRSSVATLEKSDVYLCESVLMESRNSAGEWCCLLVISPLGGHVAL